MEEQALNKKKKEKLKIKRQLKQIKYGMMMIQEISDTKVFQIPGDIILDINQLLYRDSISLISSWNDFLKVKKIRKSQQARFIEVFLDTDVQMRSDLPLPLKILKNSQQKELFDLANLIEEYQNEVDSKQFCQNINLNLKMEESSVKQEESESEVVCDEYHGWNFEKSTEKADKIISELNNQMKDCDDYYSYILFKGNKYDQNKCRIGYSTHILKDFFCLNDEQIEQLCLRKPIIFNFKYKHQYTEYIFHRINTLLKFIKYESSNFDYFRQSINELDELSFDLYSIDNLVVKVKLKTHIHVLSNYKNQMDDILYVCKFMPIHNLSASQVLKGMRNLRNSLNENLQKNVQINWFNNQQIFSDENYQKQSQMFVDKFYSIINNPIFQDILENL
ncbi:hypothetical protein ABPG74_019885 [Tetrahymena malaccensis]